jgi:hypothetical protein
MGIKTYDVMLNIVHIHTENRGIPYMPLQNIANPVYTIDGSMTLGAHLCPVLCKFAMSPKKLFPENMVGYT